MPVAIRILFASLLLPLCGSLHAMSSRPAGYTLIVVPDQFGPVQITHDLSKRHAVVMVSYQHPGDPAKPNLHVLQDGRWLPIPAGVFNSGSFLRVKPSRTIVVGPDGDSTAALLNAASAWNTQQVLNIPFNNTTDLINWYGKYFHFSRSDWRWFADQYKLTLNDENASRRQQSWYDQPYREERPSAVVPAVELPAPPSSARPRSAGFTSVVTPPAEVPVPPPAPVAEPAPARMIPPAPAPVPPPVPPPAPPPPPVVDPAPAPPAPPAHPEAAPVPPLVNEPGALPFRGWKTPAEGN
jgi:hypothetical protein